MKVYFALLAIIICVGFDAYVRLAQVGVEKQRAGVEASRTFLQVYKALGTPPRPNPSPTPSLF